MSLISILLVIFFSSFKIKFSNWKHSLSLKKSNKFENRLIIVFSNSSSVFFFSINLKIIFNSSSFNLYLEYFDIKIKILVDFEIKLE